MSRPCAECAGCRVIRGKRGSFLRHLHTVAGWRGMAIACFTSACSPSAPAPEPALEGFTEVAAEAGVDFLHWDVPEDFAEWNQDCLGIETHSAGAAAGDYDGDGWTDLFVTRPLDGNLLFHNRGGHFDEVGEEVGLRGEPYGSGAVWGDVDGDGDLDLAVANLGPYPNHLYIQNADGTFTEEGAARGIAVVPEKCNVTFSLSLGDLDGDGDLDLHTAQFSQEHSFPDSPRAGSQMLLNDGSGFFTDATDSLGLSMPEVASFTSAMADFDEDGDSDLLVTGDFGTSRLMQNDGGSFTDVTEQLGDCLEKLYAMGLAVGDIDADGDLDAFITEISPLLGGATSPCAGNRLLINDGAGNFVDVAVDWGVRDGWLGWGAGLFDFDNDGDLDIAMTNGGDYTYLGDRGSGPYDADFYADDPLRLWRNDGWSEMVEVSEEMGFVDTGMGRAFLPFDMDNDGDLDVFINNRGDHPVLFRNNVQSQGWLRVQLVAPAPNTRALGARLFLQARSGGEVQRRDIHQNATYLGTVPAEAHFGVGDIGQIRQLRVVWPTGEEQILDDVEPNQILELHQP